MGDEDNPDSADVPSPPQPSRGAMDERDDGHSPFPIVGIGASAGGFEAFQHLLSNLPRDTGMAFVFVQHLDPRHESRLTDLLSRSTPMPIAEATDGARVEPDHVYIIPPNSNLAIAEGLLHVTRRGEGRGLHLPVDYLFRSLAEDQKSRAIGVILSGTGSDGTQGLCEIKAVGGITFAQDEQSAKYNGMPHSATEGGCADFILSPEEIAHRLAEIGSHPYLVPTARPAEPGEDAEAQYRRILARVRRVTGVDFSLYRDTTIKRRVLRRMALHTQKDLAKYVQRLESDATEVEALYKDLLISVTSFFRDPELFDVLKQRVFPDISRDKSPLTPIRVWVPGCATGQEAYSLAISLVEYFDDKPVRPPIQVFATDISDPAILERARAGVYPEGIELEVTSERLRRFFHKQDHVYRIDKAIRDMCVFARQNVTSDPPFSHVDVISCRNVLIYLSSPLQKRVLPIFHYSLNTPGYLVLGSAETVGENTDLFEVVDRPFKIYNKKPTAARPSLHYTSPGYKTGTLPDGRLPPPAMPMPIEFQREADRILIGRYAPPGVLVNDNLDIIHFRGRTSTYLEAPPGEPTNNVLKMAREGLFFPLRKALEEAADKKQPVRSSGIRLRIDGAVHIVDLEVIPVTPPNSEHTCFLTLFHESTPALAPEAAAAVAPEPADEQEIDQLRKELAGTKDYLQSLVEQQDAANEELRSANEEVLSSNEELQSTNEEVETAKEELQSTNEELTTVNEQLQIRNAELSRMTDDLQNLLTSTGMPVVMVGADLKIRRFTQPARRVMNLRAGDVGRPIGELKLNVQDAPDLTALTEEVIERVQVRKREVQDSDGRWHLLRIHPYRTADNKIDGAVILLLDIDDIKQAVKKLQQHSELLELAHEAIFAYEPRGRIVYWNRGATELYGYTAEEALGRDSHEIVGTESKVAAGFEQNLDLYGHWVGELVHRTRDGRQVVVESRQQIVTRSDGSRLVLETNRDITDRKTLEGELTHRLDELKEADRHKDEFLATLAHELRNPLAPVINIVELLQMKDLPEEEARWCREALERQIKQMTRMLDDLLDVGRITGGRIELRKDRIELAKAIENAVETSRPHIDAQDHKLALRLPSEPIIINGDSARLEQIFSNLLNNAAKFTPRGGEIAIRADPHGHQVVVRVKDNGIGISPELLPRVFDMFVQEGYSTGNAPGGLGLGLTLVRRLVELHGGTIEALSAGRGLGSEFIVRLPLVERSAEQETGREPQGTARPQAPQPKRILVVDDRQEQTRSMRMLLARMGHEVHVANDGPTALQALAESRYDVALIDIGLQGMNGHELARRIRAQPDHKNLLLVAQTGWGREVDRQRSREAGFDHHLVKPIDRATLEQILANTEKKR